VLIASGSSSAASPAQEQAPGPTAPVTRVPGQAVQSAEGGGIAVVPGGATGPGTGAPPPAGGGGLMMIMFGVLAFMIVSMMLSGRKQRKQLQNMMSSLTRGDTVQTVGGVIGTIGEVRDDVVVLKIDESNGTKMKVAKTSITRVIKPSRERTDVVEDTTDTEAA
jgi:preprotein translocase subunit YajC